MSKSDRITRTNTSLLFQILTGLICLFCWYVYLPGQYFWATMGAAVSFFLIRRTLPTLLCVDWRSERLILLTSTGLGALFCLMIPITRFFDHHPLYEGLTLIHVRYGIRVAIDFIGNSISLLWAWGMISLLIVAFQAWLRRSGVEDEPQLHKGKIALLTAFFYMLPCLLVWLVFLYAYWPGILTPDSYETWLQLSGINQFYDWHPVTYTLLCWLITRIWYNPAAICLFQIGAMSLVWGSALAFLDSQGLSRRILTLATILFAILPSNAIMVVTIWKDVPYTIVILSLVLLSGMIWVSHGDWLQYRRNQIFLGIIMALSFLIRHNGVFILFIMPVALILFYKQHWKPILFSATLAVLVVFGLRNGLELGLLKAVPVPEGVQYEVPVQHIGAVINQVEKPYTDKQRDVLERIAPIDTWRGSYNRYFADSLAKPWGMAKDPEVVQKISSQKTELMAIFFNFAWRYPLIVLKSELDLTSVVWEMASDGEYLDNRLDYFPASTVANPPLDSNLFVHPNLNSPIKRALDAYLFFSNNTPIPHALMWKGGLYLFLTLMFMGEYLLLHGRHFSILVVPSLVNAASLAISIPVQNFRYIYPIVAATFLVALFGLVPEKPIAK